MKLLAFHSQGGHEWFVAHGRQDSAAVASNVHVLRVDGQLLLCDPGGQQDFAEAYAVLAQALPTLDIRAGFISHQDPDVASAIPLWDACVDGIDWHAPEAWLPYLRNLPRGVHARLRPLPDQGADLELGSARLQAIPAHYLHAAANLHLYDPQARVLFSGDVGSAFLPAAASPQTQRPLLESAAEFDAYIRHAESFHRRWMPSAAAKHDWCERVARLDIDFLCPQRGAICTGDNVRRFIEWFDALDVAAALN